MARRSSVERLPPAIVARMHEWIGAGAGINEIFAHVHTHDDDISRSAVARHVKRARAALGSQSETEGLFAICLAMSGDRLKRGAGRPAIKRLRSLAMDAACVLEDDEEPPDIEKIDALALVVRRIGWSCGALRARPCCRRGARAPSPTRPRTRRAPARCRRARAGFPPRLNFLADFELER